MDGRSLAHLVPERPLAGLCPGHRLLCPVMTNFIMNVAAIAISLPVSLVIARYLGVAPHVIFFASLATAGMPFNLLIGAAPNAIAYECKQFTAGEFFTYGWIPSLVLMALLAVFCYIHLAAPGHAGVVPK